MPVLHGLAAGLAATAPMAAFMEAAWAQLPTRERYPLPPREIAREVGKSTGMWHDLSEPAKLTSALAAHFAYGAACGGIFAAAVPKGKQNAWTGIGFGLGVWCSYFIFTGGVMLLTGFEAIEFAQQEGFTLNKEDDGIDGPAAGLSIAEASAIAVDRPDLIWLEVSDSDYFGEPKNMEPQR